MIDTPKLTANEFVKALEGLNKDKEGVSRWGLSPARLWQLAGLACETPREADSWDSFAERVLIGWYTVLSQWNSPVELAMYFHQGYWNIPGTKGWDTDYARAFNERVEQVIAQRSQK